MQKIITKEAVFELEIKKSKFISYSFIIKSKEHSETLLTKIQQENKHASHIVYAVCFDLYNCKFSDANEPKGSSGWQIFNILRTKKITNSLIIVVRYMYGSKLGLGLLQNSYKKAAIEVLNLSLVSDFKISYRYLCEIDLEKMNWVLQLIKKNGCTIEKKEFGLKLKIEFICPLKLEENFELNFKEIIK
ncbi:YigZ family protein [Mesomycoplasma ovipneumoniae]|uniref:YigZ family protein n=1 Tax=Mesomycoplasma ovipneumoniae TaxID=29562 RepID=UPI00083E716A|nr:YigZ family protein [Mesomycoplasma ovipneumoniae]